ncbi:hypothetical protein KBD45_01090 [Candidatus Dojkabacteria bacterium]|nr:hypothetical protein [Candidatus Dojkabacteria bacterium]
MKKIKVIISIVLILLVTGVGIFAVVNDFNNKINIDPENSNAASNPADKYTMRERFGVGGYPTVSNPLNMGWYFQWTNTNPYSIGLYEKSVSFMPLLGLAPDVQYPDQPGKKTCAEWKTFFAAHPSEYNDNTKVMIGNEFGFGNEVRNYDETALYFNAWKSCVKSYNSNIQVGSGATPWTHKLSGDINGREYFIGFINKLKTSYGNESLPDFIVQHGYSYVGDINQDIQACKNNLVDMRRVMNDLGLRDRDLIIKEFSPSHAQSFDQTKSYMDAVINYYATATDNNIGNPTDGNRLVQKWAWFLSNEKTETLTANPTWKYYILFDQDNNNAITPAGAKYKELIDKYVPANSRCRVQGYKQGVGGTIDPEILKNTLITLNGDGITKTCNTNPCIFDNLNGNKEYNVTITLTSSYSPSSTFCFDNMNCHNQGNYSTLENKTRTIVCPSGGYADLWWGIKQISTPTPDTTPTPSVTPSASPTPSATPRPSIIPSVAPTPSTTPSLSITPTISPTPMASPIDKNKFDLNSDSKINISDFAKFIQYYKISDCTIDYNSNNNCKDIADFAIFIKEYKKYQ